MKIYGRVKVKLQVLTLTLDEEGWSESLFTFLSPKAKLNVGTWLIPADGNFSMTKKNMPASGGSRAPV